MDLAKSCNPDGSFQEKSNNLSSIIENEEVTTFHNKDSHSIKRNSDHFIEENENDSSITTKSIIPADNFHKYCYRHNPDVTCNKQTDVNKMVEIQQNLDRLPLKEQQMINNVWSQFGTATSTQRNLILQGILTQCCFPQLSFVSQEVSSLIRIDFISTLPIELSLKVLCYLDCASLCNAAQVSRNWKLLADDDRVWHHMCEQHIDRKCPNCGWGLPLMHMKRAREVDEVVKPIIPKAITCPSIILDNSNNINAINNNTQKRRRLSNQTINSNGVRKTRPWKVVYSERFKVERNWRKGCYKQTEFIGHSDGILTLKYDYKYLITGSYDTTVKIWDVNTGKLIRTLASHTRGVKTLAFDEQKLITGSLDSTIKVWNYHTGQCISTYRGHNDGVLSVDFYKKSIVSGSLDCTIKVWNVETRTCHALRGHSEPINCVKIHPQSSTFFSASDDTTVRMWDLKTNQCLKIFKGHVAQVQKVIPLNLPKDYELVRDPEEENENGSDNEEGEENNASNNNNNNNNNNTNNNDNNNDNNTNNTNNDDNNNNANNTNNNDTNTEDELNEVDWNDESRKFPAYILTCSLDNTIKLWDVATGKCIRTHFGHVEGIWDISADTFRIVSGAHDRFVKVWDLQSGKCMHTIPGHMNSVTCVGLGDSSLASADENGVVRLLNFDNFD